eukprot:TRINITY_DN67979_c0_g1_i1.p1 TRINITY_DN67979_c0_g1~~TRINITY_DN67979_c0_g1_i1.p1  ORF type:complete len:466 (+),score=69.22 TRINITY_DN67979_c0_g1_i1:23-1399(+)
MLGDPGDFLIRRGVHIMLDGLIQHLLEKRPDDPFELMIELLRTGHVGTAIGEWRDLPEPRIDKLLHVSEAYTADTSPTKMLLTTGLFQNTGGGAHIFQSVAKAEWEMSRDKGRNKEYLAIDGHAPFREHGEALLFGKDNPVLADRCVATCQTVSGAGALRLAAEFYRQFLPLGTVAYVSDPSPESHTRTFEALGFPVKQYSYWSRLSHRLDFDLLCRDLRTAANGSIVVLQPHGHIPTGTDITREQWAALADLVHQKRHHVLFHAAGLGCASGDPAEDAWPIRHFAAKELEFAVTQSFSRNFGLAGERPGLLHFVCLTPKATRAVQSQIKALVRPMYSNPPAYGALIVSKVLGDRTLQTEWAAELKALVARTNAGRKRLAQNLASLGGLQRWDYINSMDCGPFIATGFSEKQVAHLASTHHLFIGSTGCFSLEAAISLGEGATSRLAAALHETASMEK